MSLRAYLIVMSLATILTWVILGMIMTSVNPFNSDTLHIGFFYFAALLAIWGTAALLAFVARAVLLKRRPIYAQVMRSFRQGAFLAVLVVAALLLQSVRIFTWWSALLLVAVLAFGEYLFLVGDRDTCSDETK